MQLYHYLSPQPCPELNELNLFLFWPNGLFFKRTEDPEDLLKAKVTFLYKMVLF